MNAVNDVFPEVCVKGCSFHFRQALMRRVQQEGIKSVYEKDSRYPSARTWLRMVMAMSMLPAFAAPLVWNELKNAFTTGDTVLDAKLQAFVQYFIYIFIHQYGSAQKENTNIQTKSSINKCVRTDTNPPFAFQTAFPGGTDFSVSTGRVKKLHTLLVCLYFSGR